MSKRERRDNDRRGDRREKQLDDDQQRQPAESEAQEGDSLAALKAILSKVATLLKPLQLTPEESIRLVEDLYGKVLETDLRLAGETDDTRKSSVLAAIQNATIQREGGRLVVDYSTAAAGQSESEKPAAATPVNDPADVTRTDPMRNKPPRRDSTKRETKTDKPAPSQAAPSTVTPSEPAQSEFALHEKADNTAEPVEAPSQED